MSLLDWLEERKAFWWWVEDVKKLDERAILEGVMNYGRWQDFLYIKDEFGLEKVNQLFKKMLQMKRVNLRPEKKALFENYLKHYAKT